MRTLSETRLIFRRSLREGLRDPGPAFMLPLLPPLLMLVVFDALFARLVDLREFRLEEYVDYLAPGTLALVALMGAGFTAGSLAEDLRSGYHDRLRLLACSRSSYLLGRFGFEAVRVLPAALIVLVAGAALGGPTANGAAGAAVAVVMTGLLAAAYTGIFYIAATATRNPQTPVALQPLGTVVGFLSTALVPAALMPEVARAIAEANPVSVVVDGIREAMAGSIASAELGAALGVCAALFGATHILTLRLHQEV